MSTRKNGGKSKSRGRSTVNIKAAAAQGRAAANDVLEFRRRQSGRRAATARQVAARRRAATASQSIPRKTSALLGPAFSVGTLLAEGDSWFDYPFQDVLRILEDKYLYDVESVAHKGDCVADMAHSEGQFEEFARRLEKLLRRQQVPTAILLSGGGNDIAGDELSILLNHAASSLPALNEDIIRGVIDVRLLEAYASIIGAVTQICKTYLGRPVPIVVHGYDYPIPDGRGFLGGWWKLPGPWLEPSFHRKGFDDRASNTALIGELIDRFNAMLSRLHSHSEFAHVRYVDLRGTLKCDGTYKQHWANELHPTRRGFELVAARIAEAIKESV